MTKYREDLGSSYKLFLYFFRVNTKKRIYFSKLFVECFFKVTKHERLGIIL